MLVDVFGKGHVSVNYRLLKEKKDFEFVGVGSAGRFPSCGWLARVFSR